MEKSLQKECTNECKEPRPATILPPLRIGIEFKDAVPGSNTRTAYFGAPVSASEINEYLAPSTDFLMVSDQPGSPCLSDTISADQLQPDQGKGKKRRTPENESRRLVMLLPPASIPWGVNANKQMRESYLCFILEEYQRHRIKTFFNIPTRLHGLMVALTKRPRIVECYYLGAKVFETFNGNPEQVAIRSCSKWMTRYVNRATNPDEASNSYPSAQEVKDKLNGLFELEFAQTAVLGTAAGYSSLRLALHSFLRLVSDDASLWVEQGRSGLLRVSLPAVLTSPVTELGRFVFHDIMSSLILGLPTLAEYDSTGFPIVSDIPANWAHGVHGVPMEMLVNLAEVHRWRAQGNDVDWTVLEKRALAWRWDQRQIQSEESVEMVYRAAIQETWRHTTLIYIYMGICGVTSHDPRVQASVQQIIKFMGVVRDTYLDVHLSMPSIVAGLAAPYEFQRALIIQKLKSFYGMRIWKVRGREFTRVLKHLWHGPAANGGAVVWDDYVQARYAVLPVR